LQKTLEGANVKLAAVASNILGKSGRDILAALVAGQTDGAALAELARGRLREKLPQLEQALVGRMEAHQRFLVAQQLAHVDYLDAAIERLSAEVAARLRRHEDALARLDTIPGVGRRTAEVLVAEVGTDMGRFPTAHHLASWAGMCPGNHESAGHQRRGTTRKGNPWLRAALVEAAQAAGRSKRQPSYLTAQFRRLVARRGKKRAVVAVGHSILTVAYHLLKDGTPYRDLGATYFEGLDHERATRRLVGRLEALGHRVTLAPTAA